MEIQKTKKNHSALEKTKKGEYHILLGIKIWYKAIVIKTVWIDTQMDKYNRDTTESTEMHAHIYG